MNTSKRRHRVGAGPATIGRENFALREARPLQSNTLQW
jgi:hypothetical protein